MTRLRWTAPLRDRRGAVMPLVAICLVTLLSLVALSVDYGLLTSSRVDAQRAADAASLAGASVYLEATPDPNDAEARALDYATRNRVLRTLVDAGEVSVFVDDANAAVTVHVGRTQPTWFARLFGVESAEIGAFARAQVSTSGTSGCVKPFAIPDDTYGDDDIGREVLIWESRAGNPDQAGNSNFYLVGEGNNAGGNDIRNMLTNTDCDLNQVQMGDELPAQPSNNAQGNVKTTLDKIADDYGLLDYDPSNPSYLYDGFNLENWSSHPLVATIPLYPSGVTLGAGGGTVEVVGFLRLVLDNQTVSCRENPKPGERQCQFEGNGVRQQLWATILPASGVPDNCEGEGCANLNRALRLVK